MELIFQPINWSVLSSGDGPQENSMETDAMEEANQFTGGFMPLLHLI